MFTGLVAHVGELLARRPEGGGLRLLVDLGPLAAEAAPGDSVCVQGACLTVEALEGSAAWFALSPETLARTTFAEAVPGRKFNLELALRLGDRLGGHFLTGHVDALGALADRRPEGEYEVQRFRAPGALLPLLVEKGSVGVDGVSLTVAALHDDGFSVALIPETLERTTLGGLAPDAPVHLEADLLAKHVARLLATGAVTDASAAGLPSAGGQ